MRKLSISLFVFAMALSAMAQHKDYTITGTAEGTVEGDTVFLCDIRGFYQLNNIDSTVVKGGKYTFTGVADECGFVYVVPKHNGSYKELGIASVLLEPGNITVHTFLAKEKREPEISGGVNTELWQQERSIRTSMNKELVEYWKVTMDSTATIDQKLVAQASLDSLREIQNDKVLDFMINALPKPYCELMLANNFNGFTIKQKERALSAYAEKMPESKQYKKIIAENKVKAATANGQPFIDFEMADINGNIVKVSEIVKKNKFALIDFWASWCGPCRAEMPNVVEAYNRYHDQGFEVVGVSLDSKRDDWVKAIEKLALPWIQLSDVQGWKCSAAQPYNVKSIPANFLIDHNGTIVASNLRGLTLVNTVASCLAR